jgi:glyceraldehyde 3-phosphate dehydrogenase
MAIRVAINGFGRIGRQVFQAGMNDPKIEWVAVNDLTDTKTLAYLLKHDSVYGTFPGEISAGKDTISVDGKKIKVFAEKDPSKLPWKDLGIDIVVESTGFYTHREGAELHLKAGAKKVFISAPAKNPDITVVKGVNEHLYDRKKHKIISNGSCTTNCIALLFKVLHDNFTVERGYLQTVHAYTATQRIVDAPDPKDPRRGRAAGVNLVPTSTGAATTVEEVIPDLKGRLNGIAVRVPVVCGSFGSVFAQLKKPAEVKKINWLFSEVSKHHLKGVLRYTEEPLVSTDILKDPHSCVFDAAMTQVIGNLVTVSGWYDNEWGFSNRMVDVIKLL